MLPSHLALTHRPLMNATRPSTTMDLRWSRMSHASGLSKLGGLKQMTSTPAVAHAGPDRPRLGGAQPVVQHAHAHAGARPFRQRLGEAMTDADRPRRCSSRTARSARPTRSRRATPESCPCSRAAGARRCPRWAARRRRGRTRGRTGRRRPWAGIGGAAGATAGLFAVVVSVSGMRCAVGRRTARVAIAPHALHWRYCGHVTPLPQHPLACDVRCPSRVAPSPPRPRPPAADPKSVRSVPDRAYSRWVTASLTGPAPRPRRAIRPCSPR